ncbi:ABC transporter ATP-binding protein, partial [Lactobacillus sp. XV13L]|nr:ABC transporter ATP-binding protein [Lactobacillus sp. XV13L]
MRATNNYRSIPTKEQFKIVQRLLKIAMKYWPAFLLAVFAVVVQSTMNVLLPRFLQYYMDHYLSKITLAEKIIFASGALYLLGVIIRSFGQFFTTYSFNMGSEYMLEDLRRSLFSKLHYLGMSYFDRT